MIRTLDRSAVAGLALATALAGCAGLRPKVDKAAAYDPSVGYVVGTFAVVQNGGFALVLADHLGREYRVSFGEPGFWDAARDLTGMATLPPGDYRVTAWMPYARVSGQEVNRFRFSRKDAITRPFELKAGHVVYLGKFGATTSTSMSGFLWQEVQMSWGFAPHSVTADAVPALLAREYPGFAEAPMECLLCEPAAAGATRVAGPTLPPSPAYGKEEIVLHYHRSDGVYDGWGLLVWESFDDPARPGRKTEGVRPLVGVTRDHLLPPSGKDAFGAYWALDERNFGDGQVNYVILKGQARAQEGGDRSWRIRDGKEAWVNEEDPAVHLSREAAEAARTRR